MIRTAHGVPKAPPLAPPTFDMPDATARLVVHQCLKKVPQQSSFEGKPATCGALCVIRHKEEITTRPVCLLHEVIVAPFHKKTEVSGDSSSFESGVLRAVATPRL